MRRACASRASATRASSRRTSSRARTWKTTGGASAWSPSIVGLRSIRFAFRGQQNHAGTTMMARRRDAATALYELAHRINQEFPKAAAERTVWTMGRAARRAERDLHRAGLRRPRPAVPRRLGCAAGCFREDRRAAGRRDECARRRDASRRRRRARRFRPRAWTRACSSTSRRAAERHAPGKWQHMPSGAFHDAGIISAQPALGDAVHPVHRRHQPRFRRGQPRRGHRARLPGAGRRGQPSIARRRERQALALARQRAISGLERFEVDGFREVMVEARFDRPRACPPPGCSPVTATSRISLPHLLARMRRATS